MLYFQVEGPMCEKSACKRNRSIDHVNTLMPKTCTAGFHNGYLLLNFISSFKRSPYLFWIVVSISGLFLGALPPVESERSSTFVALISFSCSLTGPLPGFM